MDNLSFRKVNENDDLNILSDLIYITDPYIYPDLFGNKEKAKIILAQILDKEGQTFSKDNYYVGCIKDEIVGLAALYKVKPVWSEREMKNIFYESMIEIPPSFYEVSEYFVNVFEHAQSGIHFCNMVVSKEHRKKGIASFMLEKIIKISGRNNIELSVLADNIAAIKLYKKFGFVIIDEFDDYGGYNKPKVKCYKMYKEGR